MFLQDFMAKNSPLYIPLNTKNEWLSVVYGSITLNFCVASGHPFALVVSDSTDEAKFKKSVFWDTLIIIPCFLCVDNSNLFFFLIILPCFLFFFDNTSNFFLFVDSHTLFFFLIILPFFNFFVDNLPCSSW